jgi:phospholipid-binding lipoprotein MlaA
MENRPEWLVIGIVISVFLFFPCSVWGDDTETFETLPASDEAGSEFFDPFDEDDDGTFIGDEGALITVSDPIEGFNRAMFTVNDRLYFWFLKPVAIGYTYVVPPELRVCVKNFFFNLLTPVRLVNCLLQGKGKAAAGELGRFSVNTTLGFLGLMDPATMYPSLNPPEEDMGQTFGWYGAGEGFYIVWPFLGPSTLRDSVGGIGDWALNPFSFMQLVNLDAGALTSSETNLIVYGVRTVNDVSFQIGQYEMLKNAALDPYESFRDAYIQNRNSKISQ